MADDPTARRDLLKVAAGLATPERNAALGAMEAGQAAFADFNAKPFFEAPCQSAMEGFFADPIHAAIATRRRGG